MSNFLSVDQQELASAAEAGKSICCISCNQISPAKDWQFGDEAVYCEDCGSHMGVKCPLCEDWIDLVYHNVADMVVQP